MSNYKSLKDVNWSLNMDMTCAPGTCVHCGAGGKMHRELRVVRHRDGKEVSGPCGGIGDGRNVLTNAGMLKAEEGLAKHEFTSTKVDLLGWHTSCAECYYKWKAEDEQS